MLFDSLPSRFIERMQRLYGADTAAVLAQEGAPARGLRVNTLKCTVGQFRALWQGAAQPVAFCPEGFQVDAAFKAGADPLHHAGAYYMQEPSAMSAVTVLAPRPGERILDLCAAPGGWCFPPAPLRRRKTSARLRLFLCGIRSLNWSTPA